MFLKFLKFCSLLVISSSCIDPHPKKNMEEEVKKTENIVVCSPEKAENISLLYSKELKNEKTFVKAASGLVLKDDSFYIIQDSSRYLAQVPQDLSGPIFMHPLASKKIIKQYEDPKKSYFWFRKERKADFEAATLLPDGRILILGSGYDAQKIGKKNHYKNAGVLFKTTDKSFEPLSLEVFYQHLLKRSDVVGSLHEGSEPRLNIEGVTMVKDNEIAFFHRSNYNKNSHDTLIIYPLDSWLREIAKKEWTLQESKLVRIDFGFAEKNGKKYPITLNDATYVDGSFYVPLSSESDKVINGKDYDGEVIWAGLAHFKIDSANPTCRIFRFTDTKMAKIEGIIADLKNPGQFFLVHDVDSEDAASQFSAVKIH